MTRMTVIILLLCSVFHTVNGQGKFAGTHASLIKKKFADEKNIPALKGYTYVEGTLLSSTNDPEQVITDVYKKNNTYIFLLTRSVNTNATMYTIEDVLEIKNVISPWQLKSATCRVNEKEDAMIIAVVRTANTAYLKKIKQAWKINLKKSIIEATGIQGIDCINEGFGE